MINTTDPHSDANLNVKLAESDAAALAELDEAPVTPEPESPPPEPEAVSPDSPAPVPEVPSATPPESKVTEISDIEKELDAIQAPKNASPNSIRAIQALKGAAKAERIKADASEKAKVEAEEKFASLETEYKGKVITPELETEIKELRELRRDFHIEHDPEFRAKYSSKLTEIDARSLGILKASGLSAEWEKFIADNGGVIALYGSSKQMPKGSAFEGQTHQQFIEETLLPKLPPIQKTRFEQALGSGIDLREEMAREIDLAKKEGSEHQKKKVAEIQDQFNRSVEEARASFGDRAKKLEYPPNASKEDRAKVDKHNTRVKKAEEAFEGYVRDGKNPSKVGRALAEAAQSQILMEELADKDAELEAQKKIAQDLQAKLDKIKASSSTGRQSAAPSPDSKPIDNKRMSDVEALQRFERGEL